VVMLDGVAILDRYGIGPTCAGMVPRKGGSGRRWSLALAGSRDKAPPVAVHGVWWTKSCKSWSKYLLDFFRQVERFPGQILTNSRRKNVVFGRKNCCKSSYNYFPHSNKVQRHQWS